MSTDRDPVSTTAFDAPYPPERVRAASARRKKLLGAEAKFSFVDAGLSATVQLGLALDQGMGVWWADPAIALVAAVIAAREGVESLRGTL